MLFIDIKVLIISLVIPAKTATILISGLITKELRNVLVSGLVLCLVYSGFFPGQGILAVVLADADSGLTETDGFISSGNYTLNFNSFQT